MALFAFGASEFVGLLVTGAAGCIVYVCLQLVQQYVMALFAFGASEFVGLLATGAAGCIVYVCLQLMQQYVMALFVFGTSEFVGLLATGAAGCIVYVCLQLVQQYVMALFAFGASEFCWPARHWCSRMYRVHLLAMGAAVRDGSVCIRCIRVLLAYLSLVQQDVLCTSACNGCSST